MRNSARADAATAKREAPAKVETRGRRAAQGRRRCRSNFAAAAAAAIATATTIAAIGAATATAHLTCGVYSRPKSPLQSRACSISRSSVAPTACKFSSLVV